MKRRRDWHNWRVRLVQEEERKRATKGLNDIQHILFEHCMGQYEKGRMDEFWNDIEHLDILFTLSNKILEEDLIDPPLNHSPTKTHVC